jgi:hypothetical protein
MDSESIILIPYDSGTDRYRYATSGIVAKPVPSWFDGRCSAVISPVNALCVPGRIASNARPVTSSSSGYLRKRFLIYSRLSIILCFAANATIVKDNLVILPSKYLAYSSFLLVTPSLY